MQTRISRILPLILIIIMIPSFVEVDLTLPGFPQMAKYFDSTEAGIQWTLVINLIGLCLLTLIYGPVSEAIGRKKILTWGCGLFFLGSIGCLIANNLEFLYFSRFLQGLGCSAIWVVGFTVCSDVYQGDKSVEVFGVLNAAISASLVMAPVIGAFIVAIYNWQATFVIVAILSFISLATTLAILPETHTVRKSFLFKEAVRDYYQLTFNFRFLIYALTPSILLAAFISYVSSVPFLYIEKLGMQYGVFAMHQAMIASCLAIVGFYSGRIDKKIGSPNCIMISVIICVVGSLLLLMNSYFWPTSSKLFTASMMMICSGTSLQFSMVFSRSLEIFPMLRGAASSLITFFRLILFILSVIFATTYFTGLLYDTAKVIAIIIFIGLALSLYVRYDLKRHK